MGARATIRVIHPETSTPIHLYTHWRGDEIARILADGIKKAEQAGRLDDYPYATRIIFDTLTALEGNSTGYGIYIGDEAQPCDVGYDTPTIQWTQVGSPVVHYIGHTHPAMAFANFYGSVRVAEVGA